MNWAYAPGLGAFGLYSVACLVFLPAIAQPGVLYVLTIGVILAAAKPVKIASSRDQSYAGSFGSAGVAGWVGATRCQSTSTRVTFARVCLTMSTRFWIWSSWMVARTSSW